MENKEAQAYRRGFCHGMDRIIRVIRNTPESERSVDLFIDLAADVSVLISEVPVLGVVTPTIHLVPGGDL